MLALVKDLVGWRRRLKPASVAPFTTFYPDFPQDFTAPRDIQQRIREVSPLAELVYFGWGRFYLVRYKPHRELIAGAERRLGEARRLLSKWELGTEYKSNPGAFRRLYGRYLFWRLATMGARPIADYPRTFIRTFGFDAIVTDFRFMEWMVRHTKDSAIDGLLNGEQDAAREAARQDLADIYKAKDAYRYLSARTHGVTRIELPHHRSGFTTQRKIG